MLNNITVDIRLYTIDIILLTGRDSIVEINAAVEPLRVEIFRVRKKPRTRFFLFVFQSNGLFILIM